MSDAEAAELLLGLAGAGSASGSGGPEEQSTGEGRSSRHDSHVGATLGLDPLPSSESEGDEEAGPSGQQAGDAPVGAQPSEPADARLSDADQGGRDRAESRRLAKLRKKDLWWRPGEHMPIVCCSGYSISSICMAYILAICT